VIAMMKPAPARRTGLRPGFRAHHAAALLLAMPWHPAARADEPTAGAAPLALEYDVSIQPEKLELSVTGALRGYNGPPSRQFSGRGLGAQFEIASSKAADGSMEFSYRFPVAQAAFKDPRQPVLAPEFFTGFANRFLALPGIDLEKIQRVKLKVHAPEGWPVVTSRGPGAAVELSSVDDLMGVLVCAGDYSAYQFDLAHRGSDASTRFHVAIRGKRDWDDKVFVDQFKRIARGQMDFFGGAHPAPVQFLALHLLTDGEKPGIPGFNRRVPAHDTILAVHTPDRPRDHFEFLGLLAHEHLHNWYPNAMQSDLGPWFKEGLTDYVAYRGLLANGLHDRAQFTAMLSKWHREYHLCLERNDQRLMPYRRGMLAAWVFDIELRRATEGKRGLTEVLRNLIDSKPAGGIVQRRHFVAMLNEVSGHDMEPLYKHLVEDDGAIDLAKHLTGTGFLIGGNHRIEIAPQTEAEQTLFDSILAE
jgi:predicted metalloprotease with PDZ domain